MSLLTLPAHLERRVATSPDACAIKLVSGGEVSYAELLNQARMRAQSLIAMGVRKGDRVISFIDDYLESYVSWFAIAFAGAIEVPVNPALRTSTLAHPIRDSESAVVLTTTALYPFVDTIAGDLPQVSRIVIVDGYGPSASTGTVRPMGRDELDSLADRSVELSIPEIWDPACIIYTSGTTGLPKGVIVPFGQIAYNMQTSVMKDPEFTGPRYSYAAPFHMSGKYNITLAVELGETLVLRPGFSLSNFWNDIRTHSCTFSQLFPQLAKLLLMQPEAPDDADNPLQFVSCLPAFPEVDQFKKRFGVKRISTGFGMTEIGGPIVNRDANASNWACSGSVVDNPSGIEIRLVDGHDQEVPRGTVGEVIVRSREPWALNSGYYKLPEVTAAAWRNGWFHTGDAMRQDEDGNYHFVDRMKDCIRRKGENISSFELEAYIRQHPDVQEVAVVGVPSDMGEEDIKAAIVLKQDTATDAYKLVADLAGFMPRFMVPRYVEFLERLPKTAATDRVQKNKLKNDPVNAATVDTERRVEASVGTKVQ